MKKLISLSAVLLAIFLISGCRSLAIHNVVDAPVDVAKNTTDDNVYKAIKKAGMSLGWMVKKVKPGVVHARLNLRHHMALVEIKYNTKNYSIIYKKSMNLKYDPVKKTIHKNYNSWINNLNNAIQLQLSGLSD